MMNLQEKIKEIKTNFRLSMNGEASRSMREKGLVYKMNFGVEIPRLKMMASEMGKDHELAQALWKEDVRECKILATMIQPVDSFYPEIADIWVDDIHTMEMAEQVCMNLFQYVPYASEKAFQWIAGEAEFVQVCGFLLLARIFMKGAELNERSENEYMDQLAVSLSQNNVRVKQAALVSAKKYVAHDTLRRAKKILDSIASFKHSEDSDKKAIYIEIKEETEDFV